MVVRWDVKKITYDKQKKKDSILVSLPGVEEGGTKKKYQFFGASLITNGTGDVIARKAADTLPEWKVPDSIIIGMSWDTTASNTGVNSGEGTHFESRLMHSILCIECRHHMGELDVKHPSNKICVINTTAPEDCMFK